MRRFCCLLQEGVGLRVRSGVTVRHLLCEALSVTPSYIAGTLSTIFLNGRPVDDIDAALLRHGDRVSLSGALPGLAGALMRRSSVLAPLRSTLYDDGPLVQETGGEAVVWVRLFNTVLDDLGPGLLRQGVLIRAERLREMLRAEQARLEARVLVNGAPLAPEELERLRGDHDGLIILVVS